MKQNRFEELLKQKLDGAEMSPPNDLWGSIESSMAKIDRETSEKLPPVVLRRPTRRLNSRTVWGYATAAAVLIGVIVIGLNGALDEQTIIDADRTVAEAIESSEPVDNIPTEVVEPVAIAQVVSAKAVRTAMLAMAKSDPNDNNSNSIAEPTNVEPMQDKAQVTQPESDAIPAKKSGESRAKVENSPRQRITHNVFAEDRKPFRKGRGLGTGVYAMNFGTGSTGNTINPTSRGMSQFMITEYVPVNGGSHSAAEMRMIMPELKHKVPVSFGLSLNYNITDRLSVETGLTYTGLTSEATSSATSGYKYKIKQRLHYLGIPVSVRYKILKGSVGSIYAKGGAMIERAVTAERTETISDARTTSNIDVSGVQPSVNAALGAELNLGRKLGLYFEPGVAYYFDANQPESYRTANPVNLTLSAGLRINFR